MMLMVLWIEDVFSHGLGVCHIVYDVWGGYRRAVPFSPLFYVWYHLVCIWIMVKTLAFWWSLHHVFVNQNLMVL